jgi:hypothetical protein
MFQVFLNMEDMEDADQLPHDVASPRTNHHREAYPAKTNLFTEGSFGTA